MKRVAVLSGLAVACLALLTAPAQAKVLSDIAYGPDKLQKIDVYLLDHPQHAPMLVMVHGGGWKRGDKDAGRVFEHKTDYWLPKGYIFVSVNYRLLPQADPLVQAGDVASALAFVEQHAAEWGGDAGKLVMMGHSAGAHLVSLISANPALASAKSATRWAGSVILDTATYDVEALMTRRHLPLYDEAFGTDPQFWRSVSPAVQLTRNAVPMMLVCSTERPDKPCPGAHAFAAQLTRQGVTTEVNEQALTHGEINMDLGEPGAYTQAVDDFITARLR